MNLKDIFASDTKPEDSKTVRAYAQEQDLDALVHQCDVDLREENDQGIYNDWLPYKQSKWCRLKTYGNGETGELRVVFMVDRLDNGLRVPRTDSKEINKFCRETEKILEKYIKAFRECFKNKAGKAVRLSKMKAHPTQAAPVALNGLYRIVAMKEAVVTTKLDGQSWPESNKEATKKELPED